MLRLDLIISIGLGVLLTFYAIQALLAILAAAQSPMSGTSLISKLFSTVAHVIAAWTTIGIVFLLPIVISWLTNLSLVSNPTDLGPFAYSGALGTIIIVLTLELSQLNDLNSNNREGWLKLLLMSLSLDLASLLLFVWPIRLRVYQTQVPAWSSIGATVLALAAGSLLSGLCVVLFAKKAGETP
jgi:hypothetical protein